MSLTPLAPEIGAGAPPGSGHLIGRIWGDPNGRVGWC